MDPQCRQYLSELKAIVTDCDKGLHLPLGRFNPALFGV